VKLIDTLEQLESWEEYKEYLKEQLKLLDGQGPFFVSKMKQDFKIEGKPWVGHAVLAGPKAIQSVNKLKKQGVMFREGLVTRSGKDLAVAELEAKLLKEARKTFLKLRLGYKLSFPGDDEGSDAEGDEQSGAKQQEPEWKKLKASVGPRIKPVLDGTGPAKAKVADLLRNATAAEKSGDFGAAIASFREIEGLLDAAGNELEKRAGKIEQAVKVWNKTEEVATKELRKLQKAIHALDDPRANGVIKGLEGILTRLGKVDDEAREAAEAAKRGDQRGFDLARDDFMRKVDGILAYVEQDELIRNADENPAVKVKIRETLSKSLTQLKKLV